MIFSTHNSIDGIVSGRKTQTRRIVKPSHWLDGDAIRTSSNGKSRVRWAVDGVYKVQPHRNKAGVWWHPDKGIWTHTPTLVGGQSLRIRITRIRREDARAISEADVIAEGFTHRDEFIGVWLSMHDPVYQGQSRIDSDWLWQRPDKHYQAWVLDFEVVT